MNAQDTRKGIQALLATTQDGIITHGGETETAFLRLMSTPADTTWPPATLAPTPATAPSLGSLRANDWPLEADAQDFFGYPPSLTQIEPGYPMHMDATPIHVISCNFKVAASLRRIFAAILAHYGGDMEKLRADGMDVYDGCYNDRNVRGADHKSMHAFGAAIDMDAEHNPLGATTGRMPRAVVDIFKAESWRWGGDYHNRKDWMHFEACR